MRNAETKIKEFLKPSELLAEIPLAAGMTVADFGCGNGHYATSAGGMVGPKGRVFALDILGEALSQTATFARLIGLYNIATKQCDLEKIGSCPLPDLSCDAVVISSLFHQVDNKDNVLREAYRVLKTGGRLLAVEWRKEAGLGPPQASRVPKEELQSLLEKFGFRPLKEISAGSFHYALLYEK